MDLSDEVNCRNYIEENRPELVINCGAFTNVDLAEYEPDLCFAINAKAPIIFAKVLKEYGGNFLQISSDYVFDGLVNIALKENHETNPINYYGRTKLLGEKKCQELKKLHHHILLIPGQLFHMLLITMKQT